MSLTRKISVIFVGLVLVSGAIYWIKRPTQPQRRADQGQPQKTAEEILQERATQAAGSLMTPIGKAFVSKNWTEFKSLYQPTSQFHQLAEIIRALYIQNQFSTFSLDDMDQVLKVTYDTLERIEPKNRDKAGLLVTQFYRLPLPQKQSSTYQQLESWLNHVPTQEDSFLFRLGLTKIVLQDLHPSEKAIKAFAAGYLSPPGVSQPEWIRMTNDIRSAPVRERCMKELFKLYPQLAGDARAQALIVLGQEPKLNPQSLAKMALDSLASEEQQAFEAGLRTLPNLISANVLNSNQKDQIVKRLTGIPDKFKTPYVTAKIGDILPQLSNKR